MRLKPMWRRPQAIKMAGRKSLDTLKKKRDMAAEFYESRRYGTPLYDSLEASNKRFNAWKRADLAWLAGYERDANIRRVINKLAYVEQERSRALESEGYIEGVSGTRASKAWRYDGVRWRLVFWLVDHGMTTQNPITKQVDGVWRRQGEWEAFA